MISRTGEKGGKASGYEMHSQQGDYLHKEAKTGLSKVLQWSVALKGSQYINRYSAYL